ncbi:MAG: hypothetical protein Q4D04_14715, partial [Clostridia bacterium]|nr:hypothetical protein [Clostridia bacterium]
MKRNFHKILAGLMAALLLLAVTPFSAMAYGNTTATISFNKNLFTLEPKTALDGLSFVFTLTPGTASHIDSSYVGTTSPSISPNTVTLSDWDTLATELQGGVGYTQSGSFTVPFTSIGLYTYTLKETSSSNIVDYPLNQAEYEVTIQVVNTVVDGVVTGIEIGSIAYKQLKDDEGSDISATSNKETDTPNFPRTQTPVDLVITKTVAGNMGDVTKEFLFSITLPQTAEVKTYTMKTDSSVISSLATATTGNPTSIVTKDSGTVTVDFKLKHGETMTIEDLPVGMVVNVTETAGGYTATIEHNDVVQAEDGTDYTIVSGTNTIDYTNTNTQVNTGINTDILPFALMFLIAAAGVVMLINEKRRGIN